MVDEKKIGDKELAAISVSVIVFGGLMFHWVSELISTLDLLELAYGTVKLFNNPLVF
jgi:hypothetical protein